MLGIHKRPMNLVEKLSTGWWHIGEILWEWNYHLTELSEKDQQFYCEFWMILNQDMVSYVEKHYYQTTKEKQK